MSAGYLIWTKGPRGPEPSRCAELPVYVGSTWRKDYMLAKHALSAEDFALSLDQLVRIYPAPAAPTDV